jgi:deazaflavin-dependent oxidoreductase (nitroreductase family)
MRLPISFINAVDKANQWVYWVSGGRVGGQLLKYSMLLLQTVGRKSGKVRTHTLLYVRDGDELVVIASNNGQDHHPGWYFNLLANPRAKVQAGTHSYDVEARVVGGEDYERLWQKLLAVRPQYREYLSRTTRHFPIVALKPLSQKEE